MLCCSWAMCFSAAASSENDHGSMNLASNTAPVASTMPSSVAAIHRLPRRGAVGENGSVDSLISGTAAQQPVTPLSKPLRLRDRDHLKFVSAQPCLACGRSPSDAHHLRFAQQRALGRKVSDAFTVPLCRTHHREIHRRGDEVAWWSKHHLDPLIAASTLWRKMHSFPADPQWSGSDGSAAAVQNGVNAIDADSHTAVQVRPHDETNPIIPTGSQ